MLAQGRKMTGKYNDSKAILVLTHSYPRYKGDFAGNFVRLFAEEAQGLGLKVYVLAPSAPKVITRENIDGIKVRRFRYFIKQWEDLAYKGDMHKRAFKNFSGLVKFMLFSLSFFFSGLSLALKPKISLIHAHWWIPSGIIGFFISIVTGRPLALSIHGTDLRIVSPRGIIGLLSKVVFGRARFITVPSRYLRCRLLELVPQVKEKVFVFPTPVEPAFFELPVEEEHHIWGRILIVARLSRQKNIGCAIKALNILVRKGLKLRLVIIGEGELAQELRGLVEKLRLSDYVEFHGFLRTHDIIPEYDRSWIFVLPSVKEGFGLVVVEAQARGIPVLGANSGAIPELLKPGKTGFVFDPESPEELANLIERLYNNKGLWMRFSAEAVRWAQEKFSYKASAKQLHKLYEAFI